ncbi:MAG: hypothetical protein M1837_003308 [Sclerophora amabilis]|nr:MAG: hypothetical protein M1837_003308 [Sclerophora amabilis]
MDLNVLVIDFTFLAGCTFEDHSTLEGQAWFSMLRALSSQYQDICFGRWIESPADAQVIGYLKNAKHDSAVQLPEVETLLSTLPLNKFLACPPKLGRLSDDLVSYHLPTGFNEVTTYYLSPSFSKEELFSFRCDIQLFLDHSFSRNNVHPPRTILDQSSGRLDGVHQHNGQDAFVYICWRKWPDPEEERLWKEKPESVALKAVARKRDAERRLERGEKEPGEPAEAAMENEGLEEDGDQRSYWDKSHLQCSRGAPFLGIETHHITFQPFRDEEDVVKHRHGLPCTCVLL